MDDVFRHPVPVRYLEVDQQGVVFNMWYLAYFDDALTGFLAAGGLPYTDLLAAGYDVQLVHTEIDWRGGVGWTDRVEVAVSLVHAGRTSFTLDFQVLRDGSSVVDGRTVYVVVAADGSGKREIPTLLRRSLGAERPLRA
ncbi:MAG: acyl-CoA thioesterase [Euzebyaceae bacterium]|jgi:acyl-CoA thioester hydrolase|nr:acyl-CoA thioesterase [Euzebyaceae bacterium]